MQVEQKGNLIVLSIFVVFLTMTVSFRGIVSFTKQPSQLYSLLQLENVEKYIVKIMTEGAYSIRAFFIKVVSSVILPLRLSIAVGVVLIECQARNK